MKEKYKKIIIIAVVIIAVIAVIALIFNNVGVEKIDDNVTESEIVPEEEISDEQLRETTISLYFINQNNEIACEIRKIDSKILLDNPYIETMNLLLSGPKYESLKTAIPATVKLNGIEKQGDCLIIDFSKEFVDDQNEDLETHGKVINQIVNTMTQFTEINRVKILIDGDSNNSFRNGNISFEQIFTVED